MPRIIIKKDDLPPVSADDEGYNLRIRLVSQDRNRVSFWTPLYTIDAPQVTEIPYGIEIKNQSVYIGGTPVNKKTINVFWRDTVGFTRDYDVYVKWYQTAGDPNAEWVYAGSTFSDSFYLVDNNNDHSVQIAVQKATYPKVYTQRYALFTSIVHTL